MKTNNNESRWDVILNFKHYDTQLAQDCDINTAIVIANASMDTLISAGFTRTLTEPTKVHFVDNNGNKATVEYVRL